MTITPDLPITESHSTDLLSNNKMEDSAIVIKKEEEEVASLPVPNPLKRVQSKIVDDECKVEVPEGWRRQVLQRQGGMSAGKFDVYYYSPFGKKLRSKKEVQAYCELHNLEVNIDLFRFARISLSTSAKTNKRKSLPAISRSPKTPKSPKPIKSQKSKSIPKKTKDVDTKVKKEKNPENPTNTFIISSEGLTKKKRRTASVWVPPKSPFNLFQESLFENPWKLLIGTIFHNKLADDDSYSGNALLWEFFKSWATPESVIETDWKEIAEVIKLMPNSDKLAKMLIKFSEEYLNKSWVYPKELHGIGKYGNDSYRIFCVNEWRKVKPTDHLLIFYVGWLWDNHTLLGID